jgi:selenide,water dikinase
LLGHLQKLCAASGVSATVDSRAVPVLPGARALAEAGQIPGGSKRNRMFVEPNVSYDAAVEEVDRVLLCDAQTSGGLLVATARPDATLAAMAARGVDGAVVGRIGDDRPGRLHVRA